jgi:hypothetical protein
MVLNTDLLHINNLHLILVALNNIRKLNFVAFKQPYKLNEHGLGSGPQEDIKRKGLQRA